MSEVAVKQATGGLVSRPAALVGEACADFVVLKSAYDAIAVAPMTSSAVTMKYTFGANGKLIRQERVG